MAAGLRFRYGGEGTPVLLLLHGLGATGDVWNGWAPLLARHWPGRWVAPDLPGHGGSPPLPAYTFAGLAAAVADLVDPDAPHAVLGHSLGGVVALALAADITLPVRGVVGLGIKVAWSRQDVDRAQAMATRPITWYASREEAAARFLRVSGLEGLVAADDPSVSIGLREQDGQWRLALDPAAFAVGAPDMTQLLARAASPVMLARGELDPMSTDEQLAALGAPTATLSGLGHNAHVEDPERSMTLLDAFRR